MLLCRPGGLRGGSGQSACFGVGVRPKEQEVKACVDQVAAGGKPIRRARVHPGFYVARDLEDVLMKEAGTIIEEEGLIMKEEETTMEGGNTTMKRMGGVDKEGGKEGEAIMKEGGCDNEKKD
jgi:hypothetical protein